MGILRLGRGWFGEVVLTEQGVFRTELRGLTQVLSQRIGELHSPERRADLGDHRCRVPVWPAAVARVTAYALGDHGRVVTCPGSGSAAFESRFYRCVVAGTTSIDAPAYDTTPGAQTTLPTPLIRGPVSAGRVTGLRRFDLRTMRGGSVFLNRLAASMSGSSAGVRPLRKAADGSMPVRAFAAPGMNAAVVRCRNPDTDRSRSGLH